MNFVTEQYSLDIIPSISIQEIVVADLPALKYSFDFFGSYVTKVTFLTPDKKHIITLTDEWGGYLNTSGQREHENPFTAQILNQILSTLSFRNHNVVTNQRPIAQNSAPAISFKICIESDTWRRPSISEQLTYLHSPAGMNRYDFWDEVHAANMEEWKNNIIIFRSYPGASGIGDHWRASGLWSLQNDTRNSQDCLFNFSDFRNRLTQVWMFSHRVQKIQWVNNRYVVTIKPTSQGVQIFQFRHSEKESDLSAPFQIVDENGTEITTCRISREISGYFCLPNSN